MNWTPQITTVHDAQTPLYVQISQAIIQDILNGRLHPGDRLPGSRALATTLDVHRNTIISAYDELIAQGWLVTEPARGTFVHTQLPQRPHQPEANAYPTTLGAALPTQHDAERWHEPFQGSSALAMQGGQPDPLFLPGTLLARAYRRALDRRAEHVLNYGDPMGYRALRHEIAQMLRARRALPIHADQVMMTQGSQMALYLLAQTLGEGIIGVEELGYRPAHAVFARAGATLRALRLDRDGVDVAAVKTLAQTGKLRALYLTPHHQYPTMVQLHPERRLALLALATQYNFLIIEDDYDNEFHYEGAPVLPLASADHTGHVAYIGTLSKVLAPGLRKGYIVAPTPLLMRLSALRILIDRQGDHVTEAALAELLEEGTVASHIRKVQRIYHQRRDHLHVHLHDVFGDRLGVEKPSGGMAMWIEVRDRAMGITSWVGRAEQLGVLIRAGTQFRVDPQRSFGTQHIRVGFAAVDDHGLTEGVQRLWQAWTQCGGR